MKSIKTLRNLASVFLISTLLSSCAIEIDGAKFRADTTTYKCKITDKGEIDGHEDDIYTVSLDIRVRIVISEIDLKITVEKSKFKLSHEDIDFHMENTFNKTIESYEMSGPTDEPDSATLKTYWVHIIANYGEGITNERFEEYKSTLKLSYDGKNLPLTPAAIYVG